MISFPKAKINLGLRITGRRDDGFHNIETIFYPVSLHDALEFVISEGSGGNDSLTVTGIPVNISPEENIVMKALFAMRDRYPVPSLKVHLHKAIPHGAGLGGGSSDASCMLQALNRYFSFAASKKDLMQIALGIGSDCPYFIFGDPAYGTGRGEILEPVLPVLSGYYLIIVNPGVGINTAEAYRHCKPAMPDVSLIDLVVKDISEWKNFIFNDFEEYAFAMHPVIQDIKKELYESGALFSAMSGSGSSVYGIFGSFPASLPHRLKEMVIYEGIL